MRRHSLKLCFLRFKPLKKYNFPRVEAADLGPIHRHDRELEEVDRVTSGIKTATNSSSASAQITVRSPVASMRLDPCGLPLKRPVLWQAFLQALGF